MDHLHDRIWLWGHEAGSHNGAYQLPSESRITPAEAARWLDIPNLIMVAYGGQPAPPLQLHAQPMQHLQQLVWSIVGDSSSKRNDQVTDLEAVLDLARSQPNLVGGIMDDFFHKPTPDGRFSRHSVEDVARFRTALHQAKQPLDLWVVVYDHELNLPIQPHLDQCDVITFWTWKAADLDHLEDNFTRLETLAPQQRKLLGCYLWDYGANQPMPMQRMREQCTTALRWLEAGRIDGVILLASCICDLEIEAVEWAKQWVAEVRERGGR